MSPVPHAIPDKLTKSGRKLSLWEWVACPYVHMLILYGIGIPAIAYFSVFHHRNVAAYKTAHHCEVALVVDGVAERYQYAGQPSMTAQEFYDAAYTEAKSIRSTVSSSGG
jgi:hypothetical protein